MTASTMDGQTTTSLPMDEALAPVCDALLSAAKADATRTLATAEHRADEIVRQARAGADHMRSQARAEGEQDAEVIRRSQSARARRRARGVVLAAQSAALEQLRDEVHRRLREAWTDPTRHDELRARLVGLARGQLGKDCEISEHTAGGVLATSGKVRVPYLLGDLADDVIDEMGHDLDRLWAS